MGHFRFRPEELEGAGLRISPLQRSLLEMEGPSVLVVRNLYDPEGFLHEEYSRPLKVPGRRQLETLAIPMGASVIPLDSSYYGRYRNDRYMDSFKPPSWREYPSFLAQYDYLQPDSFGDDATADKPRVYRIWDAVPVTLEQQQAIDVAVESWFDKTNLGPLAEWYAISAGRWCVCDEGDTGGCYCPCGEDPHVCQCAFRLQTLEKEYDILDSDGQPFYKLPPLRLPEDVHVKWETLKRNSRLNWHLLRKMAQTTSDYTEWLRDERMFNPWS